MGDEKNVHGSNWPHLTHPSGAEICLDIAPSLGCPAPVPWKTFECRWEVPVCPTFTETAIIPKKYRRIITALKYLKYLLQMPPDSFSSQEMWDPINLALSGKSWTLQTCHSTLNLTFPKSYLLTGHMELDSMGKFSFHRKTQSLGPSTGAWCSRSIR